jgi:hypothetical protein
MTYGFSLLFEHRLNTNKKLCTHKLLIARCLQGEFGTRFSESSLLVSIVRPICHLDDQLSA